MTDTPPPTPEDAGSLWDFLDDDALEMPVKSARHPEGKTYRIESPNAEVGLRLTALNEIAMRQARKQKITEADVAKLKLDDQQEFDLARDVLGDTFEELKADGVNWARIRMVMQYAYVHFTQGPSVAQEAARKGAFTGGKIFPLPGNRAGRRAGTKTPASVSDQPASRATSSRRRVAKDQ